MREVALEVSAERRIKDSGSLDDPSAWYLDVRLCTDPKCVTHTSERSANTII